MWCANWQVRGEPILRGTRPTIPSLTPPMIGTTSGPDILLVAMQSNHSQGLGQAPCHGPNQGPFQSQEARAFRRPFHRSAPTAPVQAPPTESEPLRASRAHAFHRTAPTHAAEALVEPAQRAAPASVQVPAHASAHASAQAPMTLLSFLGMAPTTVTKTDVPTKPGKPVMPATKRPRTSSKAPVQRGQSVKAKGHKKAAAANAAAPKLGDGDGDGDGDADSEADDAGANADAGEDAYAHAKGAEDRAEDRAEDLAWSAPSVKGMRVPTMPSTSGWVSYVVTPAEGVAAISHGHTEESEEDAYAIDPAWELQHARLPPIARLGWDVALAPTKLSEIVGQAAAKEEILNWWTTMKQGPTVPQAGLMMYGATGTGKTLMARLCAEHMGYTLLVPDADRGKEAAHEALAALRKHSLLSDATDADAYANADSKAGGAIRPAKPARPIALFFEHVDDVDGKARECARIVMKAWAQEVSKAPRPRSVVLFSCESPYDSSLSALRTACKLVAFPELNESSMRRAISESCVRGGVKATADDVAKVLESSNGRMRAALLGLQFIAGGGTSGESVDGADGADSAVYSAMKLDILHGPIDTARLALSTAPDANIELASVHLEDAALALHSALPASIPSMASFKKGLEALTSSLDALGHYDLVQRTHWTEASAYFVGRGAAAPIKALRGEHGCAGSAPDMRDVWRGACPELVAQKARAARQLRDARAQHEARITKGCNVTRCSDKTSRAYTVALPERICLLDQVRPSAATLEDLGILFPREWVRVSKHVDNL